MLLPFRTEIAALIRESSLDQTALEQHRNQCVHNMPLLLKLRNEICPMMGADPLVTAKALGEAVTQVHGKDTSLNGSDQATTSLVDSGPLTGIPACLWNDITLGFDHGERGGGSSAVASPWQAMVGA